MTENSTTFRHLAVLETMEPMDIFKPGNVDKLLKEIEEQVRSLVFDVSSVKGRQEIVSMAYKITRSKTALDNAGKNLVAGWKEEAAIVDRERKLLRERLSVLRNKVRYPLTMWEEGKKAAEEKEMLIKEITILHDRALLENQIFDNLQEAQRRISEEKTKAEEAARIEHEERLKKGAVQDAMLEEKQRQQAEEAARIAREEEIRRDNEQRIIEYEVAAREAEQKRVMDLKELEERSLQVMIEQAAKEESRRQENDRTQTDAMRAAQDVDHRREVNTRILKAFIDTGFDEQSAKSVIRLVASGYIPHMRILY